jgi:hypothetical protein
MNSIKSIVKKLLVGITAMGILAGLVWAVSPTLTAFAATDTTPPPSTSTPQGAPRIPLAFRAEHLVQIRQGINLERADRLSGRVQVLIDKLQAAGQDTAPLEQALAAFNTSVTSARGLHEQAAALFASHPGFDGNGKVNNATIALQTVKEIHNLQVQARQTVQPALKDLRTVLQTYRKPDNSQKNNN